MRGKTEHRHRLRGCTLRAVQGLKQGLGQHPMAKGLLAS
jgi:hypothetical protein